MARAWLGWSGFQAGYGCFGLGVAWGGVLGDLGMGCRDAWGRYLGCFGDYGWRCLGWGWGILALAAEVGSGWAWLLGIGLGLGDKVMYLCRTVPACRSLGAWSVWGSWARGVVGVGWLRCDSSQGVASAEESSKGRSRRGGRGCRRNGRLLGESGPWTRVASARLSL